MKKEYEQLNLIQRTQLQTLLKVKKSLSDIAKEMNLSRQTLYRELLRNSYYVNHDRIDVKFSCIHINECRKQNKGIKLFCPYQCEKYSPGRQHCLKKYPFVCNNCNKRKHCNFLHFYYDSEKASTYYHNRINIANNSPRTNIKEIKRLNKIISPLIKKGQSIEAILMNHPEINKSPLTIRNWIKKGLLDCYLSDLRMTGRRLPTNKEYENKDDQEEHKRYEHKVGHKYQDYLLYYHNHPDALIIELDTVIGCIDGTKSVLTIHIVQYHYQFGFILESHTKSEVKNKLSSLLNNLKAFDKSYGTIMYKTFSEILLSDNGVEFDSLCDLLDEDNSCHVFFCNPSAPYQKGACERNHVLVRFIHYKGWSFDNMIQDDINLLFSHLNSYPRKSLNGKTPYQAVLDDSKLGKEFINFTGISKVNCDDVILNPSLLKTIKK